MEAEIKARYNDTILQEAMRRYGIASDHIHLLDGFESYIYEFEREGSAFILRIGHSIRRNPNLIYGEVDWIQHLAAGGAGVAKAIPSQEGNLVEIIPDAKDGQFLATAFVKAQGRPAWEYGWSTGLYERYGELIGRMHALSRHYTPTKPEWKRMEWNDPTNMEMERFLPPSETIAAEKLRQITAYLMTLPRDATSYGLIHQDAHPANFLVDDTGAITLFDFDDCVYSWYVYDIAMVVFYMMPFGQDPLPVIQEFMPAFWRGYQRENTLDPAWLHEIPHFLKLREAELYAVIHRSFENVAEIDDRWINRFMTNRKASIENDLPLVDYDWTQFG